MRPEDDMFSMESILARVHSNYTVGAGLPFPAWQTGEWGDSPDTWEGIAGARLPN
jgi:hypothetical protein